MTELAKYVSYFIIGGTLVSVSTYLGSHGKGFLAALASTLPVISGVTLSPLEFLQRLAALVPRPRRHLIRFHGVLAPNATLRPQIVPGASAQATAASIADGEAPAASTRARMRWAQLLKRVCAIASTTCPQCGGPLTIRAAIEEPAVIAKMLTHLGLPSRAPPRAPARLDEFFQTA